jgi:MFS transporter, ACS family, solute carrier family 17 (sodium-dependent inorganic phosphate cotransporter), other
VRKITRSVAIVSMTENRTITNPDGSTEILPPEFDWSSTQKGLVLSSFFYGYILTEFIGGYIAAKIGGNRIFGIGIGVTAIMTLLTPYAAKLGFSVLLTVRIIEGIFEGVSYTFIYNYYFNNNINYYR